MKFSTRQDIDAPADFVFAQLSDFDGLERQAMRRGVEVRRKSGSPRTGVGAGWDLQVSFRGKLRDVNAQVTKFDSPNDLGANAKSGGLDMDVDVELVPLSTKRTRVTFGYEVRPSTLSARILVQSVKFAKASLQRRFERRVGKFCDLISERYETQG
jgi:hypothetical protein